MPSPCSCHCEGKGTLIFLIKDHEYTWIKKKKIMCTVNLLWTLKHSVKKLRIVHFDFNICFLTNFFVQIAKCKYVYTLKMLKNISGYACNGSLRGNKMLHCAKQAITLAGERSGDITSKEYWYKLSMGCFKTLTPQCGDLEKMADVYGADVPDH